MGELRVAVIRERCAGYGNCTEVAPDIFELDDDDVAIVTVESQPASRRDDLERAVRRCPPDAIVVTET